MVIVLPAFVAFLTFGFLYALVFTFEKNYEIDQFLIAEVAVVPIALAFIPTVIAGLLGYMAAAGWLWTLILIGATYFCVSRLLGMPAFRSAGYALAVTAFSFGAQLGLVALG